jgi:hypothetical protein
MMFKVKNIYGKTQSLKLAIDHTRPQHAMRKENFKEKMITIRE